MHIPGLPDNVAYQEDISDSTVLVNPTSTQQQITNNPSIVKDENDSNESELSSSQPMNNNVVNLQHSNNDSSSNVQGGNSSQKLIIDDTVNQQSPIESPQHNLSQIMSMNPFSDNNSQGSEGQKFMPLNPIQNEENLTSPDLSRIMSMNPFSGVNSQFGQQYFENASKSRVSKSSFDESQEEKPIGFGTQRSEGQRTFESSDPIQDLSQIMNMNLFSIDNSQSYQNVSKGVSSEEKSASFDFVNGSTSTRNALPKRSNSNSSMMGESGGNDVDKEFDFRENIRKALKSKKYNLGTQNEYSKDLAEYIPGLYRLLDLCKDDGSNGLVDKIIISKDSLKGLCNDIVPLSFKSISDINFTKLNSISFRLIGCYGNHTLIAKLILSKKIINKEIYDLLINSQSSTDKSFLRPGLYLLLVNSELGLIVHWPEIGCYEENAPSQRKKNMANLHRYLTKLTDHQLCLMSDKDLESFDWNMDNSDDDSDDDDDTCYEFEVKKSQEEQEDFNIYPGFEVKLSDKIKTEINNNTLDDIPLHPVVVESITNQSFVTRQLIKTASQLRPAAPVISAYEFPRELQTRLKGRKLHINRETMNMKSLEILVKHGLKMDELLNPLNTAIAAAKMQNDKKRDQERDETNKDIEIISNLAWRKLCDSYSPFEEFISRESSKPFNINDGDLERIRRKYPDMESQIDKKIEINSQNWYKLKRRYALTAIIVIDILKMTTSAGKKNEEVAESTIQIFCNMFMDDETDPHKLVKKHTEKPQSTGVFSGISNFFSAFWDTITFSSTSINHAIEMSKKNSKAASDIQFVQDLVNSPFFGKFDDIKQKIIDVFFEEYKKWRKDTFPGNIKEILPRVVVNRQLSERLNREFEQEKQEIETHEFERICNLLEEKYQDGSMLLNIRNISVPESILFSGYRLHHDIETTQPNQLQITIYETSLDQADTLQLQDDEFHVPKPTLPSRYGHVQYGTSFHLDPQVYDFRKISQFDNHKFLLVLWNKKALRTEIFFDTAQKLAQNFQQSYSNKPFRILNTDENYLFAVNGPKELIAIFDTRRVVLHVFSFNDGQASLYARNSNIQLLQWYSGTVPDIQYFFFIQDTEDLCFVEKGGRARIFNLINQQFRPAICNLPPNTANVLSSPDGSCIVAFVKEKIKVENSTNDDENDNDEDDDSTDDEQDSINRESDVKEICRAYIYFCTNFGGPVGKVIDLPPTIQSLEYLQFTCINRLQTHLMSFDLEDGCFNSVIVKITVERTQYRFQERVQKQSLGLVKVSYRNANYTIIEGKNTRFEKIVQKGEHIVIMGEKYNVLEVLSDTELKIDENFKQKNGFDKWMEFRIEPKTKLNGLVDAYGLMFERYPVENCIDPEQNRPLGLKIVLDVDDDIDKYGEKFEDYIIEMFKNLKRSTKKPTSILDEFTTSVITFQNLDIENEKFQKKFSSKYQLGEWIIQLCCLIPIQIAVARNNLFQPLKDGLSSNDDHVGLDGDDGYGLHVDGIAKNISFGWYEGIFKHFGDKKVKVVSSMGEQSCGKSFMLNHLVGTTFDGSAMRCTEGVWMSLVITKKYIYVALDFEGLKSLERTPQEDLFLTLFNTVVSNLILFKNQFAVNRDMSTMFQRFQDGATLFESDSKIFQAKLCIIIKDVPSADREDIVKEFKSKFTQLVSEEGEDNFISRMYKGGLDIIPWPMFNDVAWFKTLSKVNKKLDKQEAKYENARTFLQNTKVIMAKLKICDWGSLDENLIQIRVATLKRLLPTVVTYGLEQKDSEITEQLLDRDSGEPINDSTVYLYDILDNIEKPTELLPDSDIQLYDEHESFERLSEDLRCYFEDVVQPRRESRNDREWFANFDKFFKFIIERRVLRVQNWYMKNTAKFPQDNSDVVNGKYAMEQELSKLTLLWTLCGLTCHQCGLKCVKSRDHKENHDCLTDHKCHFLCQFNEAHNDNLIPKCSHKAGHEGKHACDKTNHLCGKPCSLIDKRNCQKVCSKEIGHNDDEHLCQSTIHYCGKDCSLSTHTQKGDYHCPNKCIKPHEEEHDSHRCENTTCPIQCPIPDCKERCQSDDHFHAFSDSQVDHFCGNEHQCRELCQDDGICQVVTEPKKQEETYKGLVKETSITFTKYIQLSERLKCNKKIPPNEFKHTGKHTHKENGFHYCDAQCQFCEYYCTLPYGHAQIHETKHGNMTQTEFTGEDNEFEYAGHKLRVGDQGTFVLCNLHCKDLGRHRHIDYCQSEENCKLGNQGQDIQHINEKVPPNPEKPKDFISHKLFWERTGFKDPYSVQEQQEFTKCDHECPDEKHHKSQGSSAPPPTKSLCELQLFHAPLNPSSNPPNDYGYISLDGHYFNCENPSTREAAFHIIFVLDRSSSMSYKDKKPIDNFPIYNYLIQNHNNRTGAVYQAVYQFMEARINSARLNQNQASPVVRDGVSLILFNSGVIVPFENRDLTDPRDLLNIMLQHRASGGTDFNLAIQKAGFLITTYFDPTKVNVIIFLSDGECGIPTTQLHNICKQNQTRGSPLYLYTVLFSSDTYSHSLEEMAKIAQSYHPQNSSSSALRCQYTRAIDEVNLVSHFTGVAESLRKHKPALLKKNPV
ncbi:hypothetical protein RclHR1_07470003 [Rhizophagus clarus]|nr:hypothetical protein RclHR1_07470003 [Rhizophagus clarus]